MPQIAQLGETFASQLFWLVLIFGFVFLVVGRGMVPKVMETVSVRDMQIAQDLAAAEAARAQADAEEEAWRKRENENRANAQVLVGDAKVKAAHTSEARLNDASARLDAQIAEADARIATAREGSLSQIEAVATEAATEIVFRIAGMNVDEASARIAVKEELHG